MAQALRPLFVFDAAEAARRYYFRAVFALLLLLTLVAFWDNLVTEIGQRDKRDPKIIFHALFALGWMVVLLLQATFARTGRMGLHRTLGMAGFLTAAGVTASTIYLFVAVWEGWDAMAPHVQANRILLPSFSAFILLAWFNRSRPVIHKRLVYTGSLFLLEPILTRCFEPLVLPLLPALSEGAEAMAFYAFMGGSWSAFFLSLVIYDLLVLRRVHPISTAAFVWLLAVQGFAYLG